MEFRTFAENPAELDVDLLVVAVQSEASKDSLVKFLDRTIGGALSAQMMAERFTGKWGRMVLCPTGGALKSPWLALVGAGSRGERPLSDVQHLAGTAVRIGARVSARRVGFVAPPAPAAKVAHAIELAVQGAILGSYRFSKYKKDADNGNTNTVEDFAVTTDRATTSGKARKKPSAAQARAAKVAIGRAQEIGTAICGARDLINEPAAVMTPAALASAARGLARGVSGLTVKVLTATECEKLGMGMFLGVGRGSAQEPRFVHMTYKPKKRAKRRIALIGKGVTFDSGGYSLKPSAAMMDMKVDMSGAAAVISAMGAIARIGSPYEVHGLAACAENMVSGDAYKLGDVLTAMDGTTVEINNTDAEGRLTLGDAICYARDKIKVDELFTIATLTGACAIALGDFTAGVFSRDEKLVKAWLSTCAEAGEDMWRMPLSDKLRPQLRSPIADLRNTGERQGGAITAALFLSHFAGDTPFVHTDIAGPSTARRTAGATCEGGTGIGVASLIRYACG